MNKIFGNFTRQGALKFPLDCETLESLQQLSSFAEALGARISTNAFIVSGCEQIEGETTRGEGLIFVRTSQHPEGEVLPFVGGSTASGFFHLVSTPVAVSQQGYNYAEAYTERSLAPGQGDIGDEAFAWEDTEELMTLKEIVTEINGLRNDLNTVKGEPAGVIKMFAGTVAPDGYLMCDGTDYHQNDYPKLYQAISNTFDTGPKADGSPYAAPANGRFRVPDLSGRFIVGYTPHDNDYDSIGKASGEKTHALITSEMPKHGHTIKMNNIKCEGGDSGTFSVCAPAQPQDAGSSDKSWETNESGSGSSHENRPPYYTLAYIIKT